MGGSRRLVALATALALVVTFVAIPGRADDASASANQKTVCADKYQSAQRLRAAGKLSLARADLLRCAEQTCPAFVSNDCKTWLAQVEADLPTLVFAVLDPDGRDVPGAWVRVDGVNVPRATDGLGHAVDPGERIIEVIAGEQRLTQRIVARVGEKSRRIELRLESPVHASPSTAMVAEGEPPSSSAPMPAAAYVLGGIGLVAIGVGSVLWVTGTSAAHTYNDDCGSAGCTEDQRASVRRQLVAGDLAWAVGVAAGVGAAIVVLAPRGASGPRVSVSVGGVALSATF